MLTIIVQINSKTQTHIGYKLIAKEAQQQCQHVLRTDSAESANTNLADGASMGVLSSSGTVVECCSALQLVVS